MSDCYISISLIFSYSVLFDYYVSIMRTFSFPARPIVTLVSRALFLFLFVRLQRWYLVHFLFSRLSNRYVTISWVYVFLSDCYVSISCTFCFPACPIVSFLSCAPFVFVPVQYLLLYHVHFLYSFLSKCNVTIICTFSKFSSKIPLVKNSCSFQHFPKSFS